MRVHRIFGVYVGYRGGRGGAEVDFSITSSHAQPVQGEEDGPGLCQRVLGHADVAVSHGRVGQFVRAGWLARLVGWPGRVGWQAGWDGSPGVMAGSVVGWPWIFGVKNVL